MAMLIRALTCIHKLRSTADSYCTGRLRGFVLVLLSKQGGEFLQQLFCFFAEETSVETTNGVKCRR